MKASLTENQIDQWIAFSQIEPLWPDILNQFRHQFGIKSVFECSPPDQTDDDMALGAFQVFGGLLPKDQAEDFKKCLDEYLREQESEELLNG